MTKLSYDHISAQLDPLYDAFFHGDMSEEKRQQLDAKEQEILEEGGWTWDEYMEECESRLDAIDWKLS